MKLSRIRGKRHKKYNLGTGFFYFQSFKTYDENLEIDFSINLNKHFRTIINTFNVALLFC